MMPPESPNAYWDAALAEGKFLIQRAQSTGTHYFPPRIMEPDTGRSDLEWVEASGLGRVYSVTIINQKPPTPAYHVALIELDEGPKLMSRVESLPNEAVTIGLRVKACISEQYGTPLLVFKSLDEER